MGTVLLKIDFDLLLDVEYEVVENPKACRHYPIDIIKAEIRGLDIYGAMHVGHVLVLQRKIYNRLIDSGEIVLPVSSTGITELTCQPS